MSIHTFGEYLDFHVRNPFSVEKMTMEAPTDNVIYRSRMSVSQNLMRVIAIIDDRQVIEIILRHLGLWTEPQPLPRARPPPGISGPWTYEPSLDLDPLPDYENVLTD